MLVILHVLQDRRLDGDMEIVALVGAHRHKAGTHLKAVHLARDGAVHVGNLVGIEVVAGRCRE